MQIPALHSQSRAADLPPEDLARNQNLSEEEKVHELCRQFEAVMLRQILNDAQKTVIKSDLAPQSAARDLYQDMAVNGLADAISKSGSFGFARSLEQELTRQLLHPAPTSKDLSEK